MAADETELLTTLSRIHCFEKPVQNGALGLFRFRCYPAGTRIFLSANGYVMCISC